MYKKELDKYLGLFTIFPSGFRNHYAPNNERYFLYISDKCPEDKKIEIQKIWDKMRVETKERHKKGIYYGDDYW